MNREAILERARRQRAESNRCFAGFAILALVTTLFGSPIAAGIYVAGMAGAHGFASFWEAEIRKWS